MPVRKKGVVPKQSTPAAPKAKPVGRTIPVYAEAAVAAAINRLAVREHRTMGALGGEALAWWAELAPAARDAIRTVRGAGESEDLTRLVQAVNRLAIGVAADITFRESADAVARNRPDLVAAHQTDDELLAHAVRLLGDAD